MGAWGVGNFENDSALDWVGDLQETQDASLLVKSLRKASGNADDYLEEPDCCAALAAAEVVAALKGKPAPTLPKGVTAWVGSHSSLGTQELPDLAVAAVERVKTHSELKDLWDESGETEDWEAILDGLLLRLA